VATLAGLGLALTPPAPETPVGAPLKAARRLVFVIAVLAAGAGMAGSLAARSMTIEALAGSVVVGLIGAIGGRSLLARVLGWQVAAGALELLGLAIALAAGLSRLASAYPLLAASAIVMTFGALLNKFRQTPTLSLEKQALLITGYVGAGGALVMTFGAPQHTAVMLTILGAVLGAIALNPSLADTARRWMTVSAAASEVVAVWLLLYYGHVRLLEAYTLPFAGFALLVGLLELRRRPELGSWMAYGPALVAGFLPTLAIVLGTDANAPRRIGIIAAAVITVAVGAVRRRRAPVVIGAVVTAVATVHELGLLGRALPGWALLVLFTAAGGLLVGLGATYEKRRHDLQRLRGALGRLR
jgi:hypothetical protein